MECNLHKGPNIASLDPSSGRLTRLFNPRTDQWSKHFEWKGARLFGRTSIGRVTERTLNFNDEVRVDLRQSLMDDGLFPRDPEPTD